MFFCHLKLAMTQKLENAPDEEIARYWLESLGFRNQDLGRLCDMATIWLRYGYDMATKYRAILAYSTRPLNHI